MVCDDTRRVVIIKNISSNIVEEAILVLKDKNAGKKTIISATAFNKDNSYLLKEAEDIIDSYVKAKKQKGGFSNELKLTPIRSKKSHINTIINIILVASIILLLFVVAKAF